MVKERDFETAIKTMYSILFLWLMGVFQCKTGYMLPLVTSQFRNFPSTWYTITHISCSALRHSSPKLLFLDHSFECV